MATVAVTGKVQGMKPTPKGLSTFSTWKFIKVVFILAIIGVVIYLVWKKWYAIKNWFAGGSPESGPTEKQMNDLADAATNKSGGGPPIYYIPENAPPQPVDQVWPLKKGSKRKEVYWVQVMINKVKDTGPRVAEDGDWGAKTEAKVKAAGAFFGLTRTEISAEQFLKMFCKTWPGSKTCAKAELTISEWLKTL